MQKKFRASLTNSREFTITYELVPGQGSGGQRLERFLDFARRAHEDGRIKALSITDNAGGHPALAPIAIGSDIRAIGVEPLVHFSLKDKNRNQLESHIFLYHRQGFENLLILGGDFPGTGYFGQAKPVFDLDSVQLQEMFTAMQKRGILDYVHSPESRPCRFFRGCVVSPFKLSEAEQIWQYAKLLRKMQAGADFIVTQVGFDIRKFDELIRFARKYKITAPILGNIFIPSLGVARYMHGGGVPGIILPDSLLSVMEEEERQGCGEESRLQRAARSIVILKGLGYDGVHLGGNSLDFDKVRQVLDMAEEETRNWRVLLEKTHFPAVRTWYFFSQEQLGPLNSSQQQKLSDRQEGRAAMAFNTMIHDLFFERSRMTTRIFERFCLFCVSRPLFAAMLHGLERCIKGLLFKCRMCGDCTLEYSLFLCPQSGCPKQLLNGPCGGSLNGRCEVFKERACFFVRLYPRMSPAEMKELGSFPPLPPKDWRLNNSSSWINFFTRRDHRSK